MSQPISDKKVHLFLGLKLNKIYIYRNYILNTHTHTLYEILDKILNNFYYLPCKYYVFHNRRRIDNSLERHTLKNI